MLSAALSQDWYHKKIGGYLYVVLYEDGLVKIGYSANPLQRFAYLEQYYRGRPMRIVSQYVSAFVNKCRLYEARVLLELQKAGKKELFNIPFYRAVELIEITVACADPEEDNHNFSD